MYGCYTFSFYSTIITLKRKCCQQLVCMHVFYIFCVIFEHANSPIARTCLVGPRKGYIDKEDCNPL